MILLTASAAAGLFVYREEITLLWTSVKNGATPSSYVIVAFIILPVFGFPILPLLVLMGARFGAVFGLAVVFTVIPIHLGIAYRVTNSVLQQPVKKFIRNRSVKIPDIPGDRRLRYSILFMIMPGLSYALKNYLLPLSGLTIIPFMVCGWLSQGILAVPFVVLGDAASRWGVYIFAGIAVLYALFILFARRLTAAYTHIFKPGGGKPSKRS